jgi:hypothetical protein
MQINKCKDSVRMAIYTDAILCNLHLPAESLLIK